MVLRHQRESNTTGKQSRILFTGDDATVVIGKSGKYRTRRVVKFISEYTISTEVFSRSSRKSKNYTRNDALTQVQNVLREAVLLHIKIGAGSLIEKLYEDRKKNNTHTHHRKTNTVVRFARHRKTAVITEHFTRVYEVRQ